MTEIYIKVDNQTGEDWDVLTDSREVMHKIIDQYLDKGCTVITILRGKPGAP